MSNHATVQARPRIDDRWLRQCGRDLSSCRSECTSSLRELGRLGSRLQQLDKSLEPLRRAEAVEVRQAGRELSRASRKVQALQQQIETLEQDHRTKTLASRSLIQQADQRGRALTRDLDQSRQRLAALRGDLSRLRAEAEAVGLVLQSAFREASKALADLDRLAAEGDRIQARLDRAWADTEAVRSLLQSAESTWDAVGEELGQRGRECERQATEVAMLLDVLHQSESAAFALWRGLRDQSWELAEYRVRESGVELLLQDDRRRQVAFEIFRKNRGEQDLLLELDLSGFDTKGEFCECDEHLEELLEELDDLLIIESTKVEHPHRRGPGGDNAITIKNRDAKPRAQQPRQIHREKLR